MYARFQASRPASHRRRRAPAPRAAYVNKEPSYPKGSRHSSSLARLSVPGTRLYSLRNPDGPQPWLGTGYLDRAGDLNSCAWHFKLADNPTLLPECVADLASESVSRWRSGISWRRRLACLRRPGRITSVRAAWGSPPFRSGHTG